MTLEEELGNTTIRILSYNTLDSITTGTGFFFLFQKDGKERHVIVTNKHVVEKKKHGRLVFTKCDEVGDPLYGEKINLDIKDFEKKWIFHPDPKVDLCILDMTLILKLKKPLYYKLIPESYIPNDSLWHSYTIMEEIIMIGYPKGLIDTLNNYPITRTGSVATLPKLKYNGKDEFLIDVAIFNGSSGSPVFLRQTPFKLNTTKDKISMGVYPTFSLLGIVYAMHNYSLTSNSIEVLTAPEAFERNMDADKLNAVIPINLALVIDSYKLNDFKELLFK